MKARTEASSETVYISDTFDNFTPSAGLKSQLNGESDSTGQSGVINKRLGNFSSNDAVSRKLSPARHDYAINSKDVPSENGLHPLHFNTNEALEETPAILKSLTLSGRGSDTFIYLPSLSPNSLSQNEDPCKTFVITSDKTEFVNRKNSLNQTLTVNGNQNLGEQNEYLSYVIEKSDRRKMNEEEGKGKDDVRQRTLGDLDEVDSGSREVRDIDFSIRNHQNNISESDVCDKKVQCENEKTAGDTTVLSFDKAMTGKKEQAFAKLQDELQKAHQELKLKDEEVTRLTRIREDVERELEELTASLFQEAHKMVSNAKEKQATAEKSLKESQMKVEVLTAEVVALKTLVLTSTPSRPNPHLHPQIGKEENSGGVNLFNRKHRRSPSHYNLKYGRENSPPESPVRDEGNVVQNSVSATLEGRDVAEVDPTVHKEFLNWSQSWKLDKTDPFIDRIYREDINLCLDFSNRPLAEEVQNAIETRNIYIEAVTDKSKTIFPRKCALLEVTRQCHYRMKLGGQETWYNISQMCRNRIIAVCDFINYLRYIELGLVKSSAHDIYWEIMRLRKEMVLARLGLSMLPA